jgi:hypothetical protein
MDSDRVEAEDAQGGGNAFRLDVELPEVLEDSAAIVAPLDAVPPMVSADGGLEAMVPSTGEAEETARHSPPSSTQLMAFGVFIRQRVY